MNLQTTRFVSPHPCLELSITGGSAKTLILTRTELGQFFDVTERSSHVFDDFHALKRRFESLGGSLHRSDRRLACRLSRQARVFSDLSEALLLLPAFLKHRSMLFAEFAQVLGDKPDVF